MDQEIKEDIKNLVKKYREKNPQSKSSIPASGKVYDSEELENLIEASLEGWWTESHWCTELETEIKKFLDVRFVHLCNSGSSANLLAFSTLCSPTLRDRQIKPGDEVITVAAGFPTTVNPILQNHCVPVFLDVESGSYEIDCSLLEEALSEKTKAVMIAHTLGNPFNLEKITKFCNENNLWLIEDNCDAFGSEYNGQKTGTFGDISTISFYPAHHITTAEGGAVITNNPILSKIIVSLRDWGRHCWCPTGKDNTCCKRFGWKLGDLPQGYDHKYTYSELGYNLKMSDLHAAIGVAQIKKLPEFTKARKENFEYLNKKMKSLADEFILPIATKNSEPSWFGYPISIKNPEKINRENLVRHLNERKIATRLLFAGNLTKQPYFTNNKNINYRIVGELKNTDYIMENTFWVGVYPALTKEDLDIIHKTISEYINSEHHERNETQNINNRGDGIHRITSN